MLPIYWLGAGLAAFVLMKKSKAVKVTYPTYLKPGAWKAASSIAPQYDTGYSSNEEGFAVDIEQGRRDDAADLFDGVLDYTGNPRMAANDAIESYLDAGGTDEGVVADIQKWAEDEEAARASSTEL